MKIVRITLLVVAASLLTVGLIYSSDSGNDWPHWRGSNYDGKSLQKGVFKFDQGYGLEVTWKKPLGSSYSSISIAGGRAVTMFSDSTFDYVIALDTENGDELWRFKIDSTYKGHNNSHDGQISTPTIDDDKVFVYARKGDLLALNAKNGEKIWSRDIKAEINPLEPFHGFGTSPLVMGDILFCQTGGTTEHTFCGFDKNTGKLLYSAGTDTVNYQSPVFAKLLGEEQLVSVANHHIYGLSPKTGKILWKYRPSSIWGSTNPVIVDDDKIFLNISFRESALLQLKKENDDYTVEELWKNRNIRQSFNSTVYHNGYLYGYSGRFITCLNPENGETVWKSRPPGDGFLILVDDHLVVITKQGTMHIVKASPDDYKEVASLKVFDGLTWNPASFANGSIYARNLFEIARIDIAKVDQLTLDQPEAEVLNPNGDFAKFVNKVEAASDDEKKMLIDKFIKSQKSFPVIEEERFAHFIFNGEAKDIALAGDMLAPGQELPLNKINGTNFSFASFELASDARITYQIKKDFDNAIRDPLNTYEVPAGPVMQGAASELRMPGFSPVDHFAEPKAGVARGNIETFEFESKILNNKRNVHVYLPADYAESKDRYPVLFVNYGLGAKDQMLMPNSLDNLIAGKEITPVIAVFVEQPPRAFQEYARNLRDQHAQMFAEELVPHIDQKYRTKADADFRVVTGGDEGGFAAFYAAFKYPDVFHNVAGQSTHLHKPAGGDALTKIVSESEKLPIEVYMDWGKYDLIYQNGLNWPQLNEEFVKLLKEKDYSIDAQRVNDGFGWASWRNRTDKILTKFFALKSTQK